MKVYPPEANISIFCTREVGIVILQITIQINKFYPRTQLTAHRKSKPYTESPYTPTSWAGGISGTGALTEVTAALGRVAVGVLGGDVLELAVPGDDLFAERAREVGRVVAGRGGDGDALGVPPRGLAAGALVLDQDVGGAHLLLARGRAAAVVVVAAVAGAGGRRGLRAPALVGGRRRRGIAAAGPLPGGVADAVGGGGFRPYLGVLGGCATRTRWSRKASAGSGFWAAAGPVRLWNGR